MTRGEVEAWLKGKGIPFEVTEHEPVFTIEEMERLGLTKLGTVCKNLFLRDGKGTKRFLVVMREDRRADLKRLSAQLNASRLSFASAERLMKYLGLTQGAVTPLGILNDASHQVIVVLDKGLLGEKRLGIHPCENTATLWISCPDLLKVIELCGNPLIEENFD